MKWGNSLNTWHWKPMSLAPKTEANLGKKQFIFLNYAILPCFIVSTFIDFPQMPRAPHIEISFSCPLSHSHSVPDFILLIWFLTPPLCTSLLIIDFNALNNKSLSLIFPNWHSAEFVFIILHYSIPRNYNSTRRPVGSQSVFIKRK